MYLGGSVSSAHVALEGEIVSFLMFAQPMVALLLVMLQRWSLDEPEPSSHCHRKFVGPPERS